MKLEEYLRLVPEAEMDAGLSASPHPTPPPPFTDGLFFHAPVKSERRRLGLQQPNSSEL